MPTLPLRRHIILMGLRASGKSTLGAETALLLGVPFVDLDDRTRAILGDPTVAKAFERVGEPGFRAAESTALAEALAQPPQVIALGGGTPTAPRAADALAAARRDSRALLVFLDLPLELLAERLAAHQGDRPSLTGRGVVEEIEDVARMRRPLYAALAELRFFEPLRATALVSIITSQVGSDSSSTRG